MANGERLHVVTSVELSLRGSALILTTHPERPDSATVEIVHDGRRLVLGHDHTKRVRANFLAGLDDRYPHQLMDAGKLAALMGSRVFCFQSLASMSVIYAAYLSDGTLWLFVEGSQAERDLAVMFELSPEDRATWRQRVEGWGAGTTPPEPRT